MRTSRRTPHRALLQATRKRPDEAETPHEASSEGGITNRQSEALMEATESAPQPIASEDPTHRTPTESTVIEDSDSPPPARASDTVQVAQAGDLGTPVWAQLEVAGVGAGATGLGLGGAGASAGAVVGHVAAGLASAAGASTIAGVGVGVGAGLAAVHSINANSAPIATFTSPQRVTEGDARMYARLTAIDDQPDDQLNYALLGEPIPGLSIDSDGHWSFDPQHAAYQSLSAAQTQEIVVNYKVTDREGASDIESFKLTVNGANDPPLATYTLAHPVQQHGATILGQLTATDPDAGATLQYALVGDPIPGLTISADGQWRFDPQHVAYQSLTSGQTQKLVIEYQVTDETGASDTERFEINVQGVNAFPIVLPGQHFSYTENRQPRSFIGSVEATDDDEITDYRFWNPDAATFGTTSPDGYFTIDARGRIRLTDLGAASYVNDADDTTGDPGPDNTHPYFIQARDQGAKWSQPTAVTLNELNCACDDPDLQYLIDLSVSGDVNRTLKDGQIASVSQDEYGNDVVTDLGSVDPLHATIRMVSTGGTDPSENKVKLGMSFIAPTNATDPAAFLDDLACINLQASAKAALEINSAQDDSSTYGDSRLMDHFLPSLEKVYLSTQISDAAEWAYSTADFRNYGSYAWMPNLRDITILAGGDAARLSITNAAESEERPADTLRGDDFMPALETIYMQSQNTVSLIIKNHFGDTFMKSLTSITAIGESESRGHTTVLFDTLGIAASREIEGDDGYANGYMTALEVVKAHHTSQNAKISGSVEIQVGDAT